MTVANRLPNVLILGQQKAGTTWLFHEICQHPAVAGSDPKELFFFNKRPRYVNRHLEQYRAHFPEQPGVRHYGEATAVYFWVREEGSEFDDPGSLRHAGWSTLDNIERVLGDDARFIVLFRQPVARAISAFYHNFRKGRVQRDDSILTAGCQFGMLDMGFAARQTNRWLERFSREGFLFLNFEWIRTDPAWVVQRTLRFLGEDAAELEADRTGALGARNEGLHLTVQDDRTVVEPDSKQKRNAKVSQHLSLTRPEDFPSVTREEAATLADAYADDITALQELTGWNLEHWKSRELEDIVAL